MARHPSQKEALKIPTPDVIVLDEDVAGVHTCARLREASAEVPILLLASGGTAKEARRFLQAGVTDVFPRRLLGLPTSVDPRLSHVRWPRLDALHAREAILGRLFSLLHGAAESGLAKQKARSVEYALRLARLVPWEFETGIGGRFRWSDEATTTFGIPASAPNGGIGALLRWVHPDDLMNVTGAMLEPTSHRIEYRLVLPDGRIRTILQQSEMVGGGLEISPRMTGIAQDITELREAERRIKHLAYFDTVTELPNRAALRRFLVRAVQAASTDGRRLAVLAMDLDGFKRVNDTLGHAAGDKLLREVATRIQKAIHGDASDRLETVEDYMAADAIVARLGGDEFVVVLERGEPAACVAERIGSALAKPFDLDGREVFISASIGIACFPEHGREVDELVEHADVALYFAKEQGRKNFQFFTAGLMEKTLRRMAIENGLRGAIQRDRAPSGAGGATSTSHGLTLVYQPKIEIPSRRIKGAEALMRWSCPELGSVSPGEFIPVAEESGLIVELGDWALRTACSHAASFPGAPLRVAVNVSMRQFCEPDFARSVERILAETKLPPSLLEIELTEGAVMRDPASSRKILQRLKELGVSIALDDFGTGYSSLNYLATLPIDTIKIDRSFVAALGSTDRATTITAAMIGLARGLGIDIVVEGVETTGQRDYLAQYAPLTIQGYFFAKPMPLEQLRSWTLPSPPKRRESGSHPRTTSFSALAAVVGAS